MQASLVRLVKKGLFKLVPYLKIPRHGFRRRGIYIAQVACRKIGYPPNKEAKRRREIYSYDECATSWPLSIELLKVARAVTRCFTDPFEDDQYCREGKAEDEDEDSDIEAEDENDGKDEPHLHTFLSYLTFYKRPRRDPVFMQWMKKHYTGKLPLSSL